MSPKGERLRNLLSQSIFQFATLLLLGGADFGPTDTFFGVFFALIWAIQTLGGRVTYGFHLIFHEEHDGGIRFGVASDFNQIFTSKYQKNPEKQYKNVVSSSKIALKMDSS